MKYKEVYIYIVLLIVVFISFTIPKVVTTLEEKKAFSQIYIVDKKYSTLTKNEASLDLIDTIDSKYNNSPKYDVKVWDMNQNIKEIVNIKNNTITISDDAGVLNKIVDLINQNIIEKSFLENLIKEESIIYRIWDYDNGEITYSKVKIFTNSDSFENAIATIEIENITDKIIAFTFKEQYLNTEGNKIEKYMRYLELENIKDWKFDNNALTSQSTQVKIISIQDNKEVSIQIVPLNIISMQNNEEIPFKIIPLN